MRTSRRLVAGVGAVLSLGLLLGQFANPPDGTPVEASVATVPHTTPPTSVTSPTTATPPSVESQSAESSAPQPATTETQRAPSSPSVVSSPSANHPSTPTIKSGSIVSLSIQRAGKPGVVVQGGVPLERERCKDGSLCYTPKDDFLDWVGNGFLPSFPEQGTVYGVGHSNHYREVPLNSMLVVQTGDTLVVTTTYGVFAYTVTNFEDVSFASLANRTNHGDIWDKYVPRLIVIVCEIGPDGRSYVGNHVVTAILKDAEKR